MYAFVSVLFSDADNSIGGTGQAHTVYPSVAKKAPKGGLRGAGVVRHWFDNARPFGTTQSHAGMVG